MPGVKVVVTNQQTGLTRETATSERRHLYRSAAARRRLPGDRRTTGLQARGAVRHSVERRSGAAHRPAARDRRRDGDEWRCRRRPRRSTPRRATVGQVITESRSRELPLNGRNFLQLLFLGAGAVETDGEQAAMRQGVGNAISIMGARPTSNNFMIDGTANIDTALGTPAAVLSDRRHPGIQGADRRPTRRNTASAPTRSTSSASRGRTPSTASALSVLPEREARCAELLRSARRRKPKLDQKQPGFYVGGPVWLPFYDGRNKTFFLVNYEATRIERGASAFYTVPTPDQLGGPLQHDDHRPGHRPAVPEQHHPTGRDSRGSRRLAATNGWYPGAQRQCRPGELPGDSHAAAGPGPVHDSHRSGSRQVSGGRSSA